LKETKKGKEYERKVKILWWALKREALIEGD
jgi:hypothetical protein